VWLKWQSACFISETPLIQTPVPQKKKKKKKSKRASYLNLAGEKKQEKVRGSKERNLLLRNGANFLEASFSTVLQVLKQMHIITQPLPFMK
jgi:hypothetical protein